MTAYTINKRTGCWEWRKLNATGYGPYRAIYEFVRNRKIPKKIVLHHTCFNSACVNPDHLEELTVLEHRALHAKISVPDRAAIRESTDTLAALSQQYGVTESAIFKIRGPRPRKATPK